MLWLVRPVHRFFFPLTHSQYYRSIRCRFHFLVPPISSWRSWRTTKFPTSFPGCQMDGRSRSSRRKSSRRRSCPSTSRRPNSLALQGNVSTERWRWCVRARLCLCMFLMLVRRFVKLRVRPCLLLPLSPCRISIHPFLLFVCLFTSLRLMMILTPVNRWGFTRVTRGPEMGSYYHKNFSRENPLLCLRMSSNSASKSQEAARNASVAAAAAASGAAQQRSVQVSASFPGTNSNMQNSTQGGPAAVPSSHKPFGTLSFQPGMDLAEQGKIIGQQLEALQWQVSIEDCLYY